jgi:hypothetical protein
MNRVSRPFAAAGILDTDARPRGAHTVRETFAGRGALSRLRSALGGEDEIVAQLVERLWTVRGA